MSKPEEKTEREKRIDSLAKEKGITRAAAAQIIDREKAKEPE